MSQAEFIGSGGAMLSTRSLGRGQPLALLHGLGLGSAASWYFSIALPLSELRQVILYDLRGHGDSTAPATGYGLAVQADDLDAVLRRHAPAGEPVDLAGHSLGAAIALHFALTRPDRVRRLALIDVPFPFEEHAFAGLSEARSPEDLVEGMMARGGQPGEGRRRKERRHRRLSRLFLETTLVRDLVAEKSPPAQALAALSMPVLLAAGRRSNCLDGNRALLDTMPRARLAEIDCGHEIPDEAPAELLAVLQKFFAAEP